MNLLQKKVFLKKKPKIIGFTMVEFETQPFKLFLDNGYNITITPQGIKNGFWYKPNNLNRSMKKMLGSTLVDFTTKTYTTEKYFVNVYTFINEKTLTKIEYNLFNEVDYYSKNDIKIDIEKTELLSLQSYVNGLRKTIGDIL